MNILFSQRDTTVVIFTQLSSWNRASICTVCKWFNEISVHTSMLLVSPQLLSLYQHALLRDDNSKSRRDNTLSKQSCRLIASDAHLTMRLNWISNYMLSEIGRINVAKVLSSTLLATYRESCIRGSHDTAIAGMLN